METDLKGLNMELCIREARKDSFRILKMEGRLLTTLASSSSSSGAVAVAVALAVAVAVAVAVVVVVVVVV